MPKRELYGYPTCVFIFKHVFKDLFTGGERLKVNADEFYKIIMMVIAKFKIV